MPSVALVEETPYRWRVDRDGTMRVPAVLFASRALLPDVEADRALEQARNVATLPGIVEAAYALPDVHWGYGFPIGGVAATDVERGGVVSPGGVGFDISCGVRLLVSDVDEADLAPVKRELMDALDRGVPRGMGEGGVWLLERAELARVMTDGARFAVERGYGVPADLERIEEGGTLADADAAGVGDRAVDRGLGQLGSLGSGNHFLEVQAVDEVHDDPVATKLGLARGRVAVMIHSGSRGLGHQICSDHVRSMQDAMARYRIDVPDRQLACVPVRSREGAAYLAAMNAAANYGRANRQVLAQAAREAFRRATGGELRLLYDVSHNLAGLERHRVDGEERLLCVHRKGATRALPPGHTSLPESLREVGQPAILPGSMGTASHVLVGVEGGGAFHSTAHGAGRTMSRTAARKRVGGKALRDELEAQGIAVRARSWKGLAEEAPFSYKDVDEVVLACERAGLARRVARLRPVGVVKG